MRRYAMKEEVNPKSVQKCTKGGGAFQEGTYTHNVFKIGVFKIFLNCPFCFLILLFLFHF